MRDPRGASIATLERAVAEAAADYPAALADPLQQGVGKFWTLAALDNGSTSTTARPWRDSSATSTPDRSPVDGECSTGFGVRLPARGRRSIRRGRSRSFPSIFRPEELAAAAADSETVRWLAALAAGWAPTAGS